MFYEKIEKHQRENWEIVLFRIEIEGWSKQECQEDSVALGDGEANKSRRCE